MSRMLCVFVILPRLLFTTSHSVKTQLRTWHCVLQKEVAYLWKVQSVFGRERGGGKLGGFQHLVESFRVERKWTVNESMSPTGQVTWFGGE